MQEQQGRTARRDVPIGGHGVANAAARRGAFARCRATGQFTMRASPAESTP
jgi:hypothetical protein